MTPPPKRQPPPSFGFMELKSGLLSGGNLQALLRRTRRVGVAGIAGARAGVHDQQAWRQFVPLQRGAGAAPGPRPQREERRLVTVLYADLTWRVITGQSHDPEELRGIVGGALAGLVGNVESLGGTISSISGAGLVALFGAPAAHEDDPERALRAAYRSLVGLRDYNGSISARFGIETGQVVVGPSRERGALRRVWRRRGHIGRIAVRGQTGLSAGRAGHPRRHRGVFHLGPHRRSDCL